MPLSPVPNIPSAMEPRCLMRTCWHMQKGASAEAWSEALQCSSVVVGMLLAEHLEAPALDHEPDSNDSSGLLQWAASMAAHIRGKGYSLASALLRSDTLSVLSRLLATEQRRGTAAVLDTDTVVQTLQPLARLIRLAVACPEEPIWLGQEVGKAQLRLTVLRALAASGVVEHVCRFAVTRMAGQQAGGGKGVRARQEDQRALGLHAQHAVLANHPRDWCLRQGSRRRGGREGSSFVAVLPGAGSSWVCCKPTTLMYTNKLAYGLAIMPGDVRHLACY